MVTNKYKASVLSFIVGDYEHIHEIEYKTPEFQYVMVTDNRSITSSTWEVKYVDNPHPEDPFYLCWKIRYNPWDYVDSDVVIKIDGSMQVTGDLNDLLFYYNNRNFDMMVEMHPSRMILFDEYLAWVKQRNYPVEQANKVLNIINANGYDVKNYRGLYQFNFMVQRKNDLNLKFNEICYNTLHEIAPEGKQVDRLDQTVGSFIINKYFTMMNILPVSQNVALSGRYFKWFPHGSDTPFHNNGYEYCQPYLFNQPVNTIYVME